jgi:hypothetical protein
MFLKQIAGKGRACGSWKDTALVLIVLVYSGNPALVGLFPAEPQLVALALFLGFLLARRGILPFSSPFLVVVAIFGGVLLTQCIEFDFCPGVTIAGFYVRLFIGYALMRLVPDFSRVFVRAMVALAVLSFVFYIPYMLLSVGGHSVEGLLTSVTEKLGTLGVARRSVILHTFAVDHFSPRNFGMFWEPGAFAGYLILGLIFLAVAKKDLPRGRYRRALLILSVALLTTMSTTGYIAFALIPLLHYDWRSADWSRTFVRVMVGVYILLPLFLWGAVYAYNTLPFLKEKIEKQSYRIEHKRPGWHRGRVGSLVFDWEYIKSRPLTGWGPHASTRYSLHPREVYEKTVTGMGNGFSDFTAKYGITGFLTWFIMVLVGFRRLTQRDLWATGLILALIMIELQGERFLNYPLFLGLAFLQPPQVEPSESAPDHQLLVRQYMETFRTS